jgi:hypothetical protein
MNNFGNSGPEEEAPGAGLIAVPLFPGRTQGSQQGERPPATGTPETVTEVAGPAINYHFPVEVVVIGSPTRDQIQLVADYVYDQLLTALETP